MLTARRFVFGPWPVHPGVHVTFAVSDAAATRLGPGEPGMGSTLISAWTETLGGHWTLESATVGATLTAVIPSA